MYNFVGATIVESSDTTNGGGDDDDIEEVLDQKWGDQSLQLFLWKVEWMQSNKMFWLDHL